MERQKLKIWLRLEQIVKEIRDKIQAGENPGELILEYVTLSGGGDKKDAEWTDTIQVFAEALSINSIPHTLPLLSKPSRGKEEIPWDYPGRAWYFWANLFAQKYNWTLEYIAELDVEDAIALYQEIEVAEQLNKEWEWGMSEVAYGYDPVTKKSKFHKLERPLWMQPEKQGQPIKVRYHKKYLPVGVVKSYRDEHNGNV